MSARFKRKIVDNRIVVLRRGTAEFHVVGVIPLRNSDLGADAI